eukprot:4220477-Amphidinium_carterae.1
MSDVNMSDVMMELMTDQELNVVQPPHRAPIHQDKYNNSQLPTWTISFRDFSGGRLWVSGGGILLHPMLLEFDPRCPHMVESVTQGTRHNMSLLSPSRVSSLTEDHFNTLTTEGFSTYGFEGEWTKEETSATEDRMKVGDLTKKPRQKFKLLKPAEGD